MKTAGLFTRLIIIFCSVLMVIWYAASCIINIGSIFGTLVFTAVGFCAAFFGSISAALHKLRRRKAARYLTNILFVLLGAAAVYMIVVLCFMAYYASRPVSEGATVVVLGCQVNGDAPSLMLKRRIDAAAEYLKAHPETRCIVSGGKGSNEKISEAECMYRELVKRGIDGGRIYREDKSSDTDENIRFSCEIIKQNGLSSELAIVTDGFHELRAARIAEKYGCSCGAVSAHTPFHLLANFSTREILAITAGLFR